MGGNVKIAATYSHLNGLEFLMVHRPKLWKEVVRVVEALDAKACRNKGLQRSSNEKQATLFPEGDERGAGRRVLRARMD